SAFRPRPPSIRRAPSGLVLLPSGERLPASPSFRPANASRPSPALHPQAPSALARLGPGTCGPPPPSPLVAGAWPPAPPPSPNLAPARRAPHTAALHRHVPGAPRSTRYSEENDQ